MNILVQLSHPAHFHLYKECIRNWQADGHQVFVLIKTKDILEKLMTESGIPYYNILPVAHRKNKLGILWDMFVRDWRIMRFCRQHKIDLLTGSTPEVAQVGWFTRRFAVNCGEDDMPVVPAWEKVGGPFVDKYLCPEVCFNHKIEPRTIHYPSYHELAYLHPNHFTPSADIVRNAGIDPNQTYFILRFASLGAHHDKGIKGINREIAQHLVEILKPHGHIYITSERPLEPEFEPYRIKINPLDMHHVMAFASLYIGDSQTMAAEAGVLGTPFVRFNDFVGRIGYLDELEEKQPKRYVDYLDNIDHHYNLGVGIRASEEGSVDKLYAIVEKMVALSSEERAQVYGARRAEMLADKIDYAKFLTWFIENYPSSAAATKQPDFNWSQFK